MKESTFVFGHDDALLGTLTLPAGSPRNVAFVLPNAGVIHRIGPHRINVKLARHLAQYGYASLRFDLAGLGDSGRPSASAPQHATHEAQAVDDLRAAISALGHRTAVQRFGIAGICSGAEHGFAAAVADERVTALVMIDGYAYPTAKTRWFRYWRRLRHGPATTISGWVARRAALLQAQLQGETAHDTSPAPGATSQNPPLAEYASTLQQLVDRHVQILMIHSGSFLRRYSYATQFRDAFGAYPFAARIRCEFAPQIDHTITTLAAQAALLQTITDWLRATDQLPDDQSAQPRSRYATSPIAS